MITSDIRSIITLILVLCISLGLYFGFSEVIRLKESEVQHKQTQRILEENVKTITASIEKQRLSILALQQQYSNIRQETKILNEQVAAPKLEEMGRKDPKILKDFVNKSMGDVFKELEGI